MENPLTITDVIAIVGLVMAAFSFILACVSLGWQILKELPKLKVRCGLLDTNLNPINKLRTRTYSINLSNIGEKDIVVTEIYLQLNGKNFLLFPGHGKELYEDKISYLRDASATMQFPLITKPQRGYYGGITKVV